MYGGLKVLGIIVVLAMAANMCSASELSCCNYYATILYTIAM